MRRATRSHRRAGGIGVPLLTVILAFFIGGIVVFATTGSNPLSTYKAIFEGAGLNWFIEVGAHELRIPFTDAHIPFPWNVDDIESTAAFNLQQTLINFVPLALTGLAVGFAFRCGLFNIGGQGQYLAGAVMAVWVGSELPGLPGFVHILAAIVAGALCGALWAGIAGVLKALVGTHEVISTIMLNWIAIWIGVFLFGLGRAAAERHAAVRPRLERHPRRGEARHPLGRPGAAGAPRRLLRRARRSCRLLDHAQPDDARIRGARGRLQPRGGALRRHLGRAELLPRDGDLGPVRRSGRRDRHRRLGVPDRTRTT